MTLSVTQFASLGGKARAKNLTKERRKEIAQKAGQAPKKPRKKAVDN